MKRRGPIVSISSELYGKMVVAWIFSITVPLAVGLPWAWASVFWPILMTVSLLWITGVPWAEAQALASRGDSYRKYQKRTNMFFPWVPRKLGVKE